MTRPVTIFYPQPSYTAQIKIYDFAVYANAREARAALAGAFSEAAAAGGAPGAAARSKPPGRRERRRRARAEARAAAVAAGDDGGLPSAQERRRSSSGEGEAEDEQRGLEAASWWQPLQLSMGWWPQGDAAELSQQQREQQQGEPLAQEQEQQGRQTPARRRRGGRARRSRDGSPPSDASAGGPSLADALKSSPACGVSLLLRAARDIPLTQLREEYDKILRRRLQRVGGDPDDPALPALLDAFTDAKRLPPAAVSGAAVRRGASIVFRRRGDVVEALVG